MSNAALGDICTQSESYLKRLFMHVHVQMYSRRRGTRLTAQAHLDRRFGCSLQSPTTRSPARDGSATRAGPYMCFAAVAANNKKQATSRESMRSRIAVWHSRRESVAPATTRTLSKLVRVARNREWVSRMGFEKRNVLILRDARGAS